jgi:hypothetical protein
MAILIFVFLTASSVIAQDAMKPVPPSTIDCSQFKKVDNTWTETGIATYELGNGKEVTVSGTPIKPHVFTIGGADLYDVLEKNCGSRQPSLSQ